MDVGWFRLTETDRFSSGMLRTANWRRILDSIAELWEESSSRQAGKDWRPPAKITQSFFGIRQAEGKKQYSPRITRESRQLRSLRMSAGSFLRISRTLWSVITWEVMKLRWKLFLLYNRQPIVSLSHPTIVSWQLRLLFTTLRPAPGLNRRVTGATFIARRLRIVAGYWLA